MTITLPPLCERTEDIPALAIHFLKEFSSKNGKAIDTITPEAMVRLQQYPWPGNVRELRNTLEKMVVMARGSVLDERDVPENIRSQESGVRSSGVQNDATRQSSIAIDTPRQSSTALDDVERQQILNVLRDCKNNRTKAAALLGISRRTLHRNLNQYKE